MKTKLLAILVVSLALLSCRNNKNNALSENGITDSSSVKSDSLVADSRGYIVKVGDMAPDFEIEYIGGKKIMLSSLKGKLVMLQFTASWCGVCRKEMPFIESDIWQKNKKNPKFVLLGIDFKETPDVTSKFATDMKITYPLTLDTAGTKFGLFCGPDAGVTRNIIIDKDGKIVLLTRLFEEAEFNGMVKFINEELNKMK
jgi:peroxiredoxin